MKLSIKNGRIILFKIEELNTRANLCRKYFYPASTKNRHGGVTTKKECATLINPITKSFKKETI